MEAAKQQGHECIQFMLPARQSIHVNVYWCYVTFAHILIEMQYSNMCNAKQPILYPTGPPLNMSLNGFYCPYIIYNHVIRLLLTKALNITAFSQWRMWSTYHQKYELVVLFRKIVRIGSISLYFMTFIQPRCDSRLPTINPVNCHTVNIYWVHHDDVIKWKHFARYWPFVRGIHWSPVISPNKGQWRGALIFSLICARINGSVNNREAGDLRRIRLRYDVTVMLYLSNISYKEMGWPCNVYVWNYKWT